MRRISEMDGQVDLRSRKISAHPTIGSGYSPLKLSERSRNRKTEISLGLKQLPTPDLIDLFPNYQTVGIS